MGTNWSKINSAFQGGIGLGLSAADRAMAWEKSQREKAEYDRTVAMRNDLAALETRRAAGEFDDPAVAIKGVEHLPAQGDFKPGTMVSPADLAYQGRAGANLPNVAPQADTQGPQPTEFTAGRKGGFNRAKYLEATAGLLGKYGNVDQAIKLREEVENEPFRAYQKTAQKAYQLAVMGDGEGAVRMMEQAYNNYLPDGRVARAKYNGDGSVTFMTYDQKTGQPVGKPQTQSLEDMTAQLMMLTNPEAYAKAQERSLQRAKLDSELYQARLAAAVEMVTKAPQRYSLERRNMGDGREQIIGVLDRTTGQIVPLSAVNLNVDYSGDKGMGKGGPEPAGKVPLKDMKAFQEITAMPEFANKWKAITDKDPTVLDNAIQRGIQMYSMDPEITDPRMAMDLAMRSLTVQSGGIKPGSWGGYDYVALPEGAGKYKLFIIRTHSAETPKATAAQKQQMTRDFNEKLKQERTKEDADKLAKAAEDRRRAEADIERRQREEAAAASRITEAERKKNRGGAPALNAPGGTARGIYAPKPKKITPEEMRRLERGYADGGSVGGLTDEEVARLERDPTFMEQILSGKPIGSKAAIEFAEETGYRRRRERNQPALRAGSFAKDVKTKNRVEARDVERMADGGTVKSTYGTVKMGSATRTTKQANAAPTANRETVSMTVDVPPAPEVRAFNPQAIAAVPLPAIGGYGLSEAVELPMQAPRVQAQVPGPSPDRYQARMPYALDSGWYGMTPAPGVPNLVTGPMRDAILKDLAASRVQAPEVEVAARRGGVALDGYGRPVQSPTGGVLRVKDFM